MKRLTQITLAIIFLLTLVAPGWATDYYVDSSATIAGSQTTGAFVAGDWLMQANTNAKCRFMSTTTGGIIVSAVTPGQPVSTTNVDPNNSDIWTDISATFVFTIASSSVNSGAVYSNNGNNFSVISAIVNQTTLVTSGTSGTSVPAASGTLTLVSGTGPATIAFSAYVTGFGATFTPSAIPSYNGSDANNGTSPSTPWRTITYAEVNLTYAGGNSLQLNKDCSFVDFCGLYGGGDSVASPFTVSSYGTGANPQIWAAIPKFGSDWTKTDGYTNIYQCYLSGYGVGNSFGVLVAGDAGVIYNADGDFLNYKAGLAALDAAAGWWYDTTNHILYVHCASEANPITDGNVYYVTVYKFGFVSSFYGAYSAHNPAPNYINASNFDIYYSPCGLNLGDVMPRYNSSWCIVSNINSYFNIQEGFINCGSHNDVIDCKLYHCKKGGFAFFGQIFSGNPSSPLTDSNRFIRCTYADNTSTNSTYAFFYSLSGNGSITNCSIIDCSITGACTYGVLGDDLGSGVYHASYPIISGLYVSGQTDKIIAGGYDNIIFERLNIVTTPSSTSGGAIYINLRSGTNYIRRNFIIDTNYVNIQVPYLAAGATLYCYGNTLLGKSTTVGVSVVNAATSIMFICSNTVLNATGLFQYSAALTSGTCTIKNNIAYNCGHVLIVPSDRTGLTSDFNYGWKIVSYWAASVWLDTAVTGWYAISGQDAHSYQVKSPSTSNPPGFVNGSGNLNVPTDFMLTNTAQALYFNWLCTIAGQSGFPAGVAGIDRDYFGTAMPNGGGCQDVGAYQKNRSGAWFGF